MCDRNDNFGYVWCNVMLGYVVTTELIFRTIVINIVGFNETSDL